MIYSSLHIQENPIVITISVLLIALLFLFAGNEKIVIYSDRFVFIEGALIKAFTSKKVFNLQEIKYIELDGVSSSSTNLVRRIIPFRASKLWNKIIIHFHSGEISELRTDIEKSNLIEMVNVVNEQIRK